MDQVIVLTHPILQHKLGRLRDKNTPSLEFRSLVKELGVFLAYEATRDLPLTGAQVETPMQGSAVERIAEPPVVVSKMRAGNGMLDAITAVIPATTSGHIGIYRDKQINSTVEYYLRLPRSIEGKLVLLVDPLIATALTAIACVNRLKQHGVREVRMLTLLASQTGLESLLKVHPDVRIFTLGVNETLDGRGFLVPGIGDVGDRCYST